jgi:hypothetical protein
LGKSAFSVLPASEAKYARKRQLQNAMTYTVLIIINARTVALALQGRNISALFEPSLRLKKKMFESAEGAK